VQLTQRTKSPSRTASLALTLLGLLLVSGTACQSSHQPTRRTEPSLQAGWPRPNNFFHQVSYAPVRAAPPGIEGAEFVNDDEMCMTCHETYVKTFHEGNVHRVNSCEDCHGPASKHLETRGQEPGMILSFKNLPPAAAAEVCLKCHEQNACSPGAQWRTSVHAQKGVTCISCHTAHYNVPPGTPATTTPGQTAGIAPQPSAQLVSYQDGAAGQKPQLPSLRGTSQHLGAVSPQVCYRCHGDMQEFQEIAGPHQICGPNGFNCTTCHDPHGQIRQETRTDLCLQCHNNNSPTMAWHSSEHFRRGVACTDCHNPHPTSRVPRVVEISHTQIKRPKRRQMAVQEPEACYKCHAKIYGLTALPSHHPIREGHMVCSDCHDPHGQYDRGLKEATVNLLCYKCHAEKQGPFVYEHPPVTENCAICHEPHGTVANNLLRQPATFLCLRCHSGHRGSHGGGSRTGIDDKPWLQGALYTNCTECHRQIHGSDLKAGTGAFFSR